MMRELLPKDATMALSEVAVFSMHGPHFGDRYGIASELLRALNTMQVDLLGLSCSVASIVGTLPVAQIQPCLNAIQGCFDIPAVIKKN